jgi:hypothetical protein
MHWLEFVTLPRNWRRPFRRWDLMEQRRGYVKIQVVGGSRWIVWARAV